jgi:hypothetical protein
LSLQRRARGKEGRLTDLIEGYVDVMRPFQKQEALRIDQELKTFPALLGGYDRSVEEWRKGQAERADDFNLIEVLHATYDELRHSRMLAWVLDHRVAHFGTHAQGSLGFRLFLEELGFSPDWAKEPYWVRREVAGEESRVDLEVAARGRFIIHIENKLLAAEGEDQTDREWADLQRRADELGIPRSGERKAVYALFLSSQGAPPENVNFQPVSWGRIARVLDGFAMTAIPPDVRLFAAHYARALRKFAVIEPQQEEGQDAKASV